MNLSHNPATVAGSSFTFGGFISVISIDFLEYLEGITVINGVGDGIGDGVGDGGNTCGVGTGDGKVFFGIACVMEGIGSSVLSLTISSSKA